jgi:hypothetical protein
MWALEKDLSLPTKEDSDFIRNIAPSMDGKRLAIAYPENVTVLEETSPDTWTRITVVAPLMLEPFVNVSSLNKFGHDAVSLSKDGRLLTLWSAVVTAPQNEENHEYQPALVAAFRDEGEEWRMIDQQHELIVSPVFIFEHPVIAASAMLWRSKHMAAMVVATIARNWCKFMTTIWQRNGRFQIR